VINLSEGRSPEALPFTATLKGSLVPVKLEPLEVLITYVQERREHWEKAYQALITILALPRLSRELPSLALKSVTDPFPTDRQSEFKDFLVDFKTFVKEYKLDIPEDNSDLLVKPRMRTTKGPNSETTLTSAMHEAKMLLGHKLLSQPFKNLCSLTGNTHFLDYVERVSKLNLETSDTYLGKLALVPDSLNKHRLVAIVDY
jgi:hypothetical protein